MVSSCIKTDPIWYIICFSGVKKAKSKINMDVKKKEMDLLSNSIAAYAHIKGKSHLSPTVCLLYIGLFY